VVLSGLYGRVVSVGIPTNLYGYVEKTIARRKNCTLPTFRCPFYGNVWSLGKPNIRFGPHCLLCKEHEYSCRCGSNH